MTESERKYRALLQAVAASRLCIYDTRLPYGERYCPHDCVSCLDAAVQKICDYEGKENESC